MAGTTRASSIYDPVINLSDVDRERVFALVERNLGLVAGAIHQYHPWLKDHELYEEAWAEGSHGLLIAAARYDYSGELSTYAYPWIRHQVQRYIEAKSKMVHVPLYRQAGARALSRLEQLYINVHAEPARDDFQLARFIDCSEETIQLIRSSCFSPVVTSYDAPINPSEPKGESRLERTSPDRREIEGLVVGLDTIEVRQMWRAINKLPEGQQNILILRFGPEDYSLEEIGRMLHITRERVRQRVVAAIRAVRNTLGIVNSVVTTDVPTHYEPIVISEPLITGQEIESFKLLVDAAFQQWKRKSAPKKKEEIGVSLPTDSMGLKGYMNSQAAKKTEVSQSDFETYYLPIVAAVMKLAGMEPTRVGVPVEITGSRDPRNPLQRVQCIRANDKSKGPYQDWIMFRVQPRTHVIQVDLVLKYVEHGVSLTTLIARGKSGADRFNALYPFPLLEGGVAAIPKSRRSRNKRESTQGDTSLVPSLPQGVDPADSTEVLSAESSAKEGGGENSSSDPSRIADLSGQSQALLAVVMWALCPEGQTVKVANERLEQLTGMEKMSIANAKVMLSRDQGVVISGPGRGQYCRGIDARILLRRGHTVTIAPGLVLGDHPQMLSELAEMAAEFFNQDSSDEEMILPSGTVSDVAGPSIDEDHLDTMDAMPIPGNALSTEQIPEAKTLGHTVEQGLCAIERRRQRTLDHLGNNAEGISRLYRELERRIGLNLGLQRRLDRLDAQEEQLERAEQILRDLGIITD